jgi:phosphatidylglycerophosphate synthase
MPDAARRPIATRNAAFARAAAARLAAARISPNVISAASIGFAALGAAALLAAPDAPWLFLPVIACVQLRLLCNLLDGMVAVEGGLGTSAGALWNEAPDRVADSLLLVALGYACGLGWLGWAAALVAALTAYVRLLGASLGQAQDFRGPMAKPHRMAALCVGCGAALLEAWLGLAPQALAITAAAICAGALLTCWTRLRAIASRLPP